MGNLDPLLAGVKRIAQNGSLLPVGSPPAIVLNVVSPLTATPNAVTGNIDLTGGGVGTAIFGDGSDGTATCDGTTAVAGMTLSGGNYTCNRVTYFASLTINVGVAVNEAGFPILSLALICNGHIHADGAAAGTSAGGGGSGGGSGPAGSVGGLPMGSGTAVLGGGAAGGHGGASQANVTGSLGGAGGASNLGGPFGVTAPPAWAGAGRELITAMLGHAIGLNGGTATIEIYYGGNGGAGGGASAQNTGGGGGGICNVAAATLSGSGSITANGGPGLADSTNGSGGGGGGRVNLVTHTSAGWTGTVTANGGAAASVGGLAGANGTVVQLTA